MNRLFLSIFLMVFFFCSKVGAQDAVSYAYDACGNRISRTIILSALNSPERRTAEFENTTYMEETSLERSIKFYPNPTKGMLKVEIVNMQEGDECNLSVFSMSGARIVQTRADYSITTLDLSNCNAGHYLLVVDFNGGKTTWKIIKE